MNWRKKLLRFLSFILLLYKNIFLRKDGLLAFKKEKEDISLEYGENEGWESVYVAFSPGRA